MISEPKPSQRAIGVIGGIFLTAALMFGLALALVYAYRLVVSRDFFAPIIDLLLIIIGTAAGGAAGVRIPRLSWRQTVVAALLSTAGLIAFSGFESSFPGPRVPGDSGMVLDLRGALIYLVIGGAGTLLLPLFDPAVRQVGPAPTLWKVALAAFSLTLLAILADYLFAVYSFFGLLTLVFGSFSSAVLAGIGLILALVNLTSTGAWLGGLGIVLQAFIVAAWWLLGTPWFP